MMNLCLSKGSVGIINTNLLYGKFMTIAIKDHTVYDLVMVAMTSYREMKTI